MDIKQQEENSTNAARLRGPKEIADAIRGDITSPGWSTDLPRQLATFRALSRPIEGPGNSPVAIIDLLGEGLSEPLLKHIATTLGWLDAARAPQWRRVKEILNLRKDVGGRDVPDVAAIRRCLRLKPKERPLDEQGSLVYPTTGWLGKYLDYAYDNEAPLGFHFWSGVSCLGLALRRNVVLERGNHYTYPNTYTFLIGPTASRKSTAIGIANAILRKLNYYIGEQQKILHVTGGSPEDPYLNHKLIILPDQGSPEKMISKLDSEVYIEDGIHYTNDAIGLFTNDEVANVLSKDSPTSLGYILNFTTLYDCNDQRVRDTFAHGENPLRNICFSLLAGSTKEWIRDFVTAAMFKGGFMGRSMVVSRDYSGKEKPHPPPMDPILEKQLAQALLPWAMQTLPIVVSMDEGTETGDIFAKWYHSNIEQVKSEPPESKMSAYLVRKQGHLLKLAMILQVSEYIERDLLPEITEIGSVELEPRYLHQALNILAFEEQFLPDAYADIGGRGEDEAISIVRKKIHKLASLSKLPDNRFAKSALTKAMSGVTGLKKSTDYQPYLTHLEDLGEVLITQQGRMTWIRLRKNEEIQ